MVFSRRGNDSWHDLTELCAQAKAKEPSPELEDDETELDRRGWNMWVSLNFVPLFFWVELLTFLYMLTMIMIMIMIMIYYDYDILWLWLWISSFLTLELVLIIALFYDGWYNIHVDHTHTRIYTARTGVLPGEVRFDCAGPVFYEIRDVVHLPRWITRFVSKTRNPKPWTPNPKP